MHSAPSPPHFPPGADARLRRLRYVAWLLDRSIPIGRWRIGLDPILGLVPGAGDWIGAVLSLYVLYEGARLGLPVSLLARMAGNILVEAVGGTVPILGDFFDAAWQANFRNFQLIETHYRPEVVSRSFRQVAVAFAIFAVCLLGALAAALVFVVRFIVALVAGFS
jgi:hypothetical protein